MRSFINSKFVLCLVLTAYCLLSYAQSPDTLWTKTYGSTGSDRGWSVMQTSDSGYIFAGYTSSFGVQSLDYYLVKTDPDGDTLWTRTYGGQFRDEAYAVTETSDRGYIVAGWSSSFASGRFLWIVKTDSIGDTLWTRLYQRTGYSWGWSIQECMKLETYVVSGHDNNETYLMKIDRVGDTLWTRKYGGGVLYSVQETPDSGFIATGYLFPSRKLYLVRTDKNGDTLWTKTYGEADYNYGRSVLRTFDGGYIVAGHSTNNADYDIDVIKTDENGDTLWTRKYGGASDDCAYHIAATSDLGYIIVGHTASSGAGGLDMWIFKIDAFGDTVWTKTIGGAENEIAYAGQQTADQGYVVGGYTLSFGAGQSDYYLVKLTPETWVRETAEVTLGSIVGATIISGSISLPKDKRCRVFDVTGREINILHLAPGIYFVEIEGKVTQKAIKIR